MRQFAAQISGGMLQCLDDLGGLLMTAEMGHEDLRMRQVRRDLDGGDRHHADARILEVEAKQIGKLALNLVADALCALGVFFHDRLHTSLPAEVESVASSPGFKAAREDDAR